MVLESHTHADGQRPQADGEEPRRGRSRDRGGRDRRGERGDRPAREDGFSDTQPTNDAAIPVAAPLQPAAQPPVGQRYATGFASQDANGNSHANGDAARREEVPAAAPMRQEQSAREEQPVLRQEPAPRTQPAPREQQAPRAEAPRAEGADAPGLPRVQRFDLPVGDLSLVAQGSGLQWVNSDAEKIAAVQAAIAAEPKPIHVPRERAPAVVVNEGPLVLVETKRDLRETKLPFEQPSGTSPQQ